MQLVSYKERFGAGRAVRQIADEEIFDGDTLFQEQQTGPLDHAQAIKRSFGETACLWPHTTHAGRKPCHHRVVAEALDWGDS